MGKVIESNALTLLVERDFNSTMGMQMKAGRSFSGDFVIDDSTAFIINESAAKNLVLTHVRVLMSQ